SLGSLAVAIGLAIEDDPARSVDLTPREVGAGSRRRPNLVPVLLPAAAVVPIAVLGIVFAQAHGKVSDRQSHLSSLQQQLDAMPQPRGPQIDASLRGAEAARASAVAQVLGGRASWDGMLSGLARVLPENVWLTSLKASVPSPLSTTLADAASSSKAASSTPAPLPTPTGVDIEGYTYSPQDVAVLLARLSALPTLANVQLGSATTATIGKKNVVQFKILADLREAGGGA
ncbi:MAG TPA: PilN domain-containing protein, partial [Gaiellaceae bacterium]|nr:PilN domain-containing protein [Gaiellaceae bacterium]